MLVALAIRRSVKLASVSLDATSSLQANCIGRVERVNAL
jgi:hypothetical protein